MSSSTNPVSGTPRPLSATEQSWIREILQVDEHWKNADISGTQVISEGPCDEGLSIMLKAPEPQSANPPETAGYIGRICIQTDDNCYIEVRLDQVGGRLNELFVLFVDPKHPSRTLPQSWNEVSHHAVQL